MTPLETTLLEAVEKLFADRLSHRGLLETAQQRSIERLQRELATCRTRQACRSAAQRALAHDLLEEVRTLRRAVALCGCDCHGGLRRRLRACLRALAGRPPR